MSRASRLRVLVVAGWYPSVEDHLAGVFVLDHARAAAVHHDVAVLAIERGPVAGWRLAAVRDGVEYGLATTRLRVSDRVPAALAGLVYVPLALRLIMRCRREAVAPDVIHAHVYAAGLLGVAIGAVIRAPVVVSEHLSSFQIGGLSRLNRRLAQIAFRRATIVCPVSDALRRATQPLAPRTRFVVVPNVVDIDVFRPADGPRHPPRGRVLFVGALDELKGVSTLLRAAAIIRDSERALHVDLVGRTPQLDRYLALAAELGLSEDALRVHGVLTKAQLAGMMRDADVLVLPSRTETFGIVVIEALSCGLPVVGTRVGALPELIGADAGVLVPPGEPRALAAAIERVLDHPETYDGEALAARTRERYGLSAIGDRWRAVYRMALDDY